jgi:hypothetical protein
MKATRSPVGIGFLALATLVGGGKANAQLVVDDAFEVFRIRCQIDIDVNPNTGLEEPKVQIQVKARADLLDRVDIWVTRYPGTGDPRDSSSVVSTFFDLGSATADWDTFPDPVDPNVVTILGDFVVDGDQIQAHARDTSSFESGQQVTDVAECATKVSSQFRQQTKPPKICDMPGDEDKLAEGKCVLP